MLRVRGLLYSDGNLEWPSPPHRPNILTPVCLMLFTWSSASSGGFGEKFRNILLGTGTLLFGACPSSRSLSHDEPVGQAPPQTSEPVPRNSCE